MSESKETPQKKNKDPKVNAEVAEGWFNDWLDAMDLDLNEDDMDEEDLNAFIKQKRRVIREIMRGNLTFNDAEEAVFTPSNDNSKYKEPITFHERTGASVMEMDGKKKNQDVRKMYAILSNLTGLQTKVFAGLVGSDIKICEALFVLLMD